MSNSITPQEKSPPLPWERVHHVSNYYDVPLEGLTDFNGQPHVFFFHDEIHRKSKEDPDDIEIDVIYALHPASQSLIHDLQEKHAMFERWHQAYTKDKSAMEHHPAMPEDRERYDVLKSQTTPVLESLRKTPATARMLGVFASNRREVEPGCSRWGSFEVQWIPVPQL